LSKAVSFMLVKPDEPPTDNESQTPL
jgi:hypothetical protein